MSTALAVQRTPELIATEINSIKSQTRMMVLCNSIEIGRRLIEAKSMIPHGEWGKWLETSVEYSQSTANNLMRIFEEYGAAQLSLFGSEAKSQALGKLSYTQAVILLGLPGEEREQFVENNDIENMSTRELQQAIKDLAQARKEIEEKEEEARKLHDEKDEAKAQTSRLLEIQTALNARLAEVQKKLTDAQANDNNNELAEQLQESLEKTDEELMEAQKRIEELEQKLKDKPIDIPAAEVVEKIPEEIEQELAELRKHKKSSAAVKYSLHFSNLVKGFQDLLGSLAEVEQEDPEEGERYRHATLELISKMSARL